MFDLRQIQCFIAVGEELHFGRAARRLFMTQPPLSRQIRSLEYELQIQLLVRTSRSVKLTPAGNVFLRESRKLISQAENAAASARRAASGESGLLHLGFTAGSSYSLLPKMLAQIEYSLKGVHLVLHEMVTRRQIEALHAHTIDIGLLRLPPQKDNIESICVAREPMVLAIPARHRLAKGPTPTLSDLQGEPFITYDPLDGQYFYELINGLFSNAAIPTRYIQRVSQIHSILALVSAGQGLALIPESARALHLEGTVIRKMKMRQIYAELYLAWKTDSENPALPHFRKLAIESFAVTTAKTS